MTLVFVIFFQFYCSAQVDSTKLRQTQDTLVNSICRCISNVDSNLINTSKDASDLLMLCVQHNSELFKNYVFASGIDEDHLNQQNGTKIAQHIAVQVASNCTYMRALVKRVKSQSPPKQSVFRVRVLFGSL